MLAAGQYWRPTTDVRISHREILEVGTLFVRYRRQDYGMSPRFGRCTAWAFKKWVKKWEAELVK